MSWLKSSSIVGASLGKLRGSSSPSKEFDPTACYDSFRKHWQQICDIFDATKANKCIKNDDVFGVVANLDHMVTLLILELRSNNLNLHCLDHVLSENILDRLYDWSLQSGRYENVLRLEQLKLFEVLVTHSNTQLLVHEPFHRPLLNVLASCADVCFSVEVEKRLVVLLNQLCVSLVHYNDLLELFFDNRSTDRPKFVIFSLLIPFVHREGALGQQARDALLLCIGLSKQNEDVANFIIDHSNVCPVLATGLSGLYSLLPRKLTIEADDWYRLTADDITDIPELSIFMNSLEFCNTVVQMAHPVVKAHLIEFTYQGFLVPVMGPALLQDNLEDPNSLLHRATEQELTTATAYFDLFLRSVTEPGLLNCFLRFLLKETYDGQCIIESLIQRINSPPKLSLVTLALMESLVELNCEDVMVELIFKHLIPCNHLMASHRTKMNHVDIGCYSAEKFLQLCPNIQRISHEDDSCYGDYNVYLADARSKITSCAIATSVWTYLYNGEQPPISDMPTICVDGDTDHSLDGSSGYESFARAGEVASESGSTNEFDSGSDMCQTFSKLNSPGFNAPSIGPFLEVLFSRLENMITDDLHVNLHLTGLVSRLAIYPQPLLRSFLLDHTLVFQPSIKSLFQILRSLKQRIDNELKDWSPSAIKQKVRDNELALIERELRIVNAKKYSLLAKTGSNDSFDRGDAKRSSFSTAISSVFRRNSNTSPKTPQLEPLNSGYRYIAKTDSHNVILCAILLTEWLKELAAIAQEHSIYKSISSPYNSTDLEINDGIS